MIHPSQRLRLFALSEYVLFKLDGRATLASIVAIAQGSPWGTAVLTPKWTNDQGGPLFDFLTTEIASGQTTIGPGSGRISWLNVQGKGFLALVVTTAESADETVDVTVCDDTDG